MQMQEGEVVEKRNFSCYLTSIGSTIGTLPAILKILAIIWDGVSFQYSYGWQIGQIELPDY